MDVSMLVGDKASHSIKTNDDGRAYAFVIKQADGSSITLLLSYPEQVARLLLLAAADLYAAGVHR
jgi:hypothetical protein